MVKHVVRKVIALPVGRVTMGVDDLIEILEGQEFTKVTAKNGEFEFESLEDIKKHKSMITGNPYFDCDGIYLEFATNGSNIGCYNPKQDSYEKSMSLLSSIREKKSLEDAVGDNFGIFLLINLLLTAGVLVSIYYFDIEELQKGPTSSTIGIVLSLMMLGFMALTARQFYLDFFRKSIQPKKMDGWIKRHWSQIAASVVTAIIVLVVSAILRDYTGE